MSITYIDTDLLEQMRDRMYKILSRLEEAAGTLRQTYNQMQTEDTRLSGYPQWSQAVASCNSALQKVERLYEKANQFLMLLKSAPEEYAQLERQHIQAIESMCAHISSMAVSLSGVMAADYPVGLEDGENTSSAIELEKQVAAGVQALELANLMAVTQVLKDGYGYDQVLPGANKEQPEKDEKKKKKTSKTDENNEEGLQEEIIQEDKEDDQQA